MFEGPDSYNWNLPSNVSVVLIIRNVIILQHLCELNRVICVTKG